MVEFNAVDAFLTLLIGIGPLKPLVAFPSLTRGMDTASKRRAATTAVAVAGLTAVGLLMLGAALEDLFHFSDAALAISGGIILLLLALQMLFGRGQSAEDPSPPADPTMVGVFPLGLPLTLNPVGIVAIMTFSTTTSWTESFIVVGLIAVVMAIDFAALMLAGQIKEIAPPVLSLIEVILGILLAALAVQLILVGLEDVGIATDVTYE